MNAALSTVKRDQSDPGGVLLIGEIEYVRNRLAGSIGAAKRPALVRALLEAIDSHARVRRLASQLLEGEDLIGVNGRLQELWTLIQARASDRPIA
jgi:hypothetical protein